MVLQVPLPYPHMGQKHSGLPKAAVLTLDTHSHPAECSPDLLRGSVSIPHDQAEDQPQKAGLGQALPTAQHRIAGESQGGDHDVDVLAGVHLLHLDATDQLQAL